MERTDEEIDLIRTSDLFSVVTNFFSIFIRSNDYVFKASKVRSPKPGIIPSTFSSPVNGKNSRTKKSRVQGHTDTRTKKSEKDAHLIVKTFALQLI